jgi:7-cyano-7-deazaguanine reductase
VPGHAAARPRTRRHRVRARQWCIESKSLKLYLWGFRDRAVFAEALAAEIANEVMTTAQPKDVTVTLTQRPRGGIEVQAVARLHR